MGQNLPNLFTPDPPETFSRDELTLVQQTPLPDHLELECPVCLQVMADPHIVSCCGHHFCESCIQKAKKTSRFCPLCKMDGYDVMPDRGLQRVIRSLPVRCLYHQQSCKWTGELQYLSAHMNRRKRDGECLYAQVSCANGCGFEDERQRLRDHELGQCTKRTVNCRYCGTTGKHEDITTTHLGTCQEYPVPCPNECRSSLRLPRRRIRGHLKGECPLVDVRCDYVWAGCEWEGFRRDLEVHTERSGSEHLLLVGKAMVSLQEENEQLRKEVDNLKTIGRKTATELRRQASEIETLKSDFKRMKSESMTPHRSYYQK